MVDKKNDVPLLKGKVAASISCGDEIVITELLFSGFFQDLEPEYIAAVLSSLVYTDNKSDGKPVPDQNLQEAYEKLIKVAGEVATVMVESNMDIKKDDYIQKFAPDMMEITLKWCQGAKFSEICEISESIFEGTIIRCLRRLDELIS